MELIIKTDNSREFFHKSGIEWAKGLNYDLKPLDDLSKLRNFKLKMNQIAFVHFYFYPNMINRNEEYDLPGTDYWMFQHFPLKKLVFPDFYFFKGLPVN
jgi:hypothetical protein